MATVLKAFKTVNRVFRDGETVSPSDVDAGSSMSYQDLVDGEFIGDAPRPPSPPTSDDH